jgi:hypothetical protein
MSHVQPNGVPTVFSSQLAVQDLANYSHFTFDISKAQIVHSSESAALLFAEVAFNTPLFGSPLQLARIVAREGHAPFKVSVEGRYDNGMIFREGVMFVPEPGTTALVGLGAILIFRRPRKCN